MQSPSFLLYCSGKAGIIMTDICVFDLDGTLVDSMTRYAAGILSVLDDEGISYTPDLIGVLTPLGYTKSAELYQTMGVPGTVEDIVRRIEAKLVDQYANHIPLKAGVNDYLRKRKAEGAKLYVLTASPHIVTDICLQHNGVYDLFDAVWSVEDYGIAKGDVRVYEAVAQRIGCSTKDITFFDDNLTALSTGKAAGCYCVAVYDRHTEEEFAALCDAGHTSIRSFTDLL